jgi:amino acid adenylation domain-containing protein/non-ribosomal peptide synthase protein (TIGR01720 family)
VTLAPSAPPETHDDFPLSYAQQRLWFMDQLSPGNPFYNVPAAVRLGFQVQPALLERCLNEIVRRHEVLRTAIVTVDGQPMQRIVPAAELRVEVVDLSGLASGEREAEAQRLAGEAARRPFDLAQAPLLRAGLLRLGASEWVLLLATHHIVSDGWSMGVLFEELTALYGALAAGRPAALPELPVQYADFAVWQREWLSGAVLEEQLGYWRGRLADLPALQLPIDRPRPAVQSYRGACHRFAVPAALQAALRALARERGVTLFMLLLAAFDVLLARYTGQDDLVIGTPIANRNRPELEKLIGFFANTVVMRTDASGDPTFLELLARVKETALGAYAHQDVPFEMLVETLHPQRDLSRNPLVQVTFQVLAMQAINAAASPEESIGAGRGTSVFDLSCHVFDSGSRLDGEIEYATDLFEAASIERLAGHYLRLLEAIAARPGQHLSELPMLSPAERRRLLEAWNATEVRFPQADQCVHQLFEAQAARNPDAVAVVHGDRQLTYGELDARANRLANHLRARGVGPEALVGLCLERSVEMVVGLLGVLKAGGAYVPLDPGYPHERLALMLQDAQPQALLTQASLADTLPPLDAPVLRLDADWPLIARSSPKPLPPGAGPDNLAYVIFTSGSTGQPKGVMVEHRALTNHMLWMQSAFPLTPDDAVLQKTPCSFDASIWEFYAPWLAGGRLVLARQDGHRDPGYMASEIARQRITVLQVVPTLLELLLDTPAFGACDSLQRVFCGGEVLTAELQARFFETLPAELHNLYGPTEACIDAVVWSCDRAARPPRVPIGRPVANVRCYVVDGRRNPVPIGAAGELLIAGAALARGYRNQPGMTAERFIPDPFDPRPGERVYTTGDLVRYRPDGAIEYLGRLDQQLKVHGHRIETGDIEAALTRHPMVAAAAVAIGQDRARGSQLVAYVTGRDGVAPGIPDLRRHLGERLPEFMVPAAFVVLDRLPTTPNGKVDRRALPAPDSGRPELEAAYVAPSTPAEETLARIWGEVLGLDQVGVRDNFFELGGDSILSIQIVARGNKAGLRLNPQMLFQHQTIAELALVAEAGGGAAAAEQGELSGPAPLLPIEHWWLEPPPADPQHFNQAVLFPAPGLEPALLERCLAELLGQHDALRLRLWEAADGWRQEILPAAAADVRPAVVDLGAAPPAEWEARIERHTAEWQASLDPAAGRLLAAGLFLRGPDHLPLLFLAAHHIAVDGVSWRVLLEDLEAAYAQLRQGRPVQLPPKTASVRQWGEALADWAASDAARTREAVWLRLAEVPPVPLPQDAGGDNHEGSAAELTLQLGAAETAALLHEAPAAYRAQIQDVLLTALAAALADWTASPRVWLNLEGHGREAVVDLDVSRTVGWFTSLYPVVLEADPQAPPGQQLQNVKEQLRAVPDRGLSFGVLRYLSPDPGLRARLAHLPKPEIAFNYLGQLGPAAGERHRTGPARSPRQQRRHLLEINGAVQGGVLELTWTYSPNRHRPHTIQALADNFLRRLRQLVDHCLSPNAGGFTPSDFPDLELTAAGLERVLNELQAGG